MSTLQSIPKAIWSQCIQYLLKMNHRKYTYCTSLCKQWVPRENNIVGTKTATFYHIIEQGFQCEVCIPLVLIFSVGIQKISAEYASFLLEEWIACDLHRKGYVHSTFRWHVLCSLQSTSNGKSISVSLDKVVHTVAIKLLLVKAVLYLQEDHFSFHWSAIICH